MTIESKDNNMNYLLDQIFTKVNRLSVLSFEKIDEKMLKKITVIYFHIIMNQTFK